MFRLNSIHRTAALLLALTISLGLSACGNDDEGNGKTVANTPTGDQTKLPEPPKVVAANESAKERGNDVLDWLKLTPEKADKKANDPPKLDQKAEVAKALAPTPLPPPREVPATAPPPPQIASAAPIDRPTLQPVSATAREARETRELSTPAAPVVAIAAPVTPAATQAPAAELRLISREQPGFPVEAARKGVASGHVRARISVSAEGLVTKVEVIQSSPPRVFDNAVVTAVSRWKYAPMAESASTVTEFDFKEND